MRKRSRVALVALALIALSVAMPAAAEKNGAEECAKLGFQRDVVRCTICESLLEHTGSKQLREECLACCTDAAADGFGDDGANGAVYTKARFEFRGMTRALQTAHDELAQFKEKYASEPYFGAVVFVEAGDAHVPRVVLLGEGGERLEMRLARWAPHKIHEFLAKMLKV